MDKSFSIISLPAAQNAMIAVGIALHSGRARSPWPLLDRDILGSRILDLMLLLSADALPKSIRAWIVGRVSIVVILQRTAIIGVDTR